MTAKEILLAVIKLICGILLVGILIFLPAGTLKYFNGWLLMGVLFIPMCVAGILLMIRNPALLKKRLNAKEQQKEQDLVVKASGLMFIVGFVVAGLGHRLAGTRCHDRLRS